MEKYIRVIQLASNNIQNEPFFNDLSNKVIIHSKRKFLIQNKIRENQFSRQISQQ